MAIYEKGGQNYFASQLVTYISDGDNDAARSFLAGTKNLHNLYNGSGKTLLHIAARYGNAVMSKYFIDIGFEVDAMDNFGMTPLALAVHHRHVDTIGVLLDADADVYSAKYRDSLLQSIYDFYASRKKPVETYNLLYEMFCKRVCADFKEDKEAASQRLYDGKCPLQLAVTILKSPQVTKYYIKRGFDINTPDRYTNCRALHAAVDASDLANVKCLLDNGADINALDYCMQTPVFYYNYASKDTKDKLEILRLLITRGASLTIPSKGHITPLEYLLSRGNVKTIILLLKHRPIDFASKAYFRFGQTPLHILAKNSRPGIMEATIEGRKLDVNVRDQQGYSPLMVAVLKNKNLSSVEYLLDKGANVNANNNGQTPLTYSVSCATRRDTLTKVALEICRLLLLRGADVQHVFKLTKKKKVLNPQATIFDIILENEQWEISKLLIAHLALKNAHGQHIKAFVRAKIQSNKILHDQFNVCKEQIEKMKVARINESLILFDLLTDDEDSVVHHEIDFEFVSKLDELMSNILQENTYYVHIIEKRLENSVKKVKATKEFKATASTRPSCCIA